VGGSDLGKSSRQREFGDRVRDSRLNLGLSQEALALDAGINRSYIASLEAGQRNPSLEMMARVAIALQIDLADLVAGLQEIDGRRRRTRR
jgi:transcriptional regulator with XRE-family HTH domain